MSKSKSSRRSSSHSRHRTRQTHRSQSGCIQRTTKAVHAISSSIYKTTPIDLTSRFPQGPTKAFGNGKSGAYIFLVDTPRGQHVVKYYHDAYKGSSNPMQQRFDAINNVRPFREVLTLSALSDTDGFSTVYRVHVALTPVAWFHQLNILLPKTKVACGLFIEMSLAPGQSLNQLDLTKFNNTDLRAIGFRILHLIGSAQKILGSTFLHNDLHPGNIIVNSKKRVITTVYLDDHTPIRFKGPQVTIIDFDLAHVPKSWFIKSIGRSTVYAKFLDFRNKCKPFHMITFQFLIQNCGISPTVLQRMFRASKNDLSNWFIIMHVLLNVHRTTNSHPCTPILCHSVTGCFLANQHLLPIRSSSANATRKRGGISLQNNRSFIHSRMS